MAYPLGVYYAHARLDTRTLGAVMLVLLVGSLAIRSRGGLREFRGFMPFYFGASGILLFGIFSDDRFFFLLLPAAVSLCLFIVFASTLWGGRPMIERFARVIEDDLPDFTLPYCRCVTWVWCAFFLLNSIAVVGLASAAPLGWWAFYTGLIFYGLLGGLMGGEFLFRKIYFRYYGEGSLDRILGRMFPAHRTERGRRSIAYTEQRDSPPQPEPG